MQRHEIPTHLGVEDRAFLGLTMRQLMTAAVGLALAYGAFTELPLPLAIRWLVAGLVLLAVGLLTLWQPAGRPLEEWAFALIRFRATPRVAVWRPVTVLSGDRREREPHGAVVRLPMGGASSARPSTPPGQTGRVTPNQSARRNETHD